MVFSVISYFILYEWYPEPFFTAQGGWQGVRLMVFVGLVLGPMLTLIAFNHLKPRKLIIFDLSIIVTLQVVALVFSAYAVYTQRPIALVFWGSAFYTVTEEDYHAQGMTNPDFSQYSSRVPPLIYSRPVSTQAELDYSEKLTQQSIPAYAHIEFYDKVEDNLEEIFVNEVDIKEIAFANPTMLERMEELTKQDLDAYKYIALKAKYNNMILVLSDEGELIGAVSAPSR